jgi:hypothetical protein
VVSLPNHDTGDIRGSYREPDYYISVDVGDVKMGLDFGVGRVDIVKGD